MSDAERIASILGDWYAGQDEGIVTPPEEVIERHPLLAAQLRARFEALGLLECHFSTSEEPAAHPHPRIPGYEIVREVGRGAMGLVYEAQQASLGRRVALKVLSPAVTVSPKAVKRFRREAKAAARLHHTNIVPIYGMGREGSHWFYAMELVNGPPLSQVVTWMRAMSESRGELDAAASDAQARDSGEASAAVSALTTESGSETHKWYVRVADMFAGVADALQLAHENGIVHRDVKPSNLMLSPDGALRVVDFGLASLEDPDGAGMTMTGDMLGTPLYMSPEQVRASHDEVGPRSDIYGLGASLYEVLTLSPPFPGKNLPDLTAKILREDPVLPRRQNPRIPRDLETIVLKALEKDPVRRYATAAELAADLRRFADGHVVTAARVGPLGRAWRRINRHKTRAVLVATAAVALLVGAFLGARAMEEAERRRNVEYDLLLGRAQEAMALTASWADETEAGDLEVPDDTAMRLLGQAVALVPERPEAWWLRSLVAGRASADRLRDLDRAGACGLPPRTLHVARTGLLEAEGRWAEAEEHRRRAASYATRTPADAYYEAQTLTAGNRQAEVDALLDQAVDGSPRGSAIRSLALRARARRSMLRGDHPQALEDLYALVARGDESSAVAVGIAAVYHDMGKAQVATEQLTAVRERVAKDGSSAAWKAFCVACRLSGRGAWHDEAAALAIEAYPEEAHILREVLLAQRRAGDREACLETARRAVALRPDTPLFHVDLARAHFALEQDEEALAAYDRALSLQGDRPSAACEHGRGRVLARMHESERALEAYRRAHALDPRSVVTQYCIGLTLSELDRPEESLAAYDAALAIDDTYVWTHVNKGHLLHTALGRDEEALACFEAARRLAPKLVNVHWGAAVVLRALGRNEEALKAVERALEIDPENGPSHHNHGLILFDAGRPEEAVAAFDRALELGIDDSRAHNGRGLALQAVGRHDDAMRAYTLAVERDPGNRTAWQNRGCLRYEVLHDYEGALADAERALALGAPTAALLCNKALAQSGIGEKDAAIETFGAAVEVDADFLESYVSRGAILHDYRREYEKALADFRRALQIDPNDLRANLFRGVALQSLGRLEGAHDAYSKVVELEPADPRWRLRRGLLLCRSMEQPREALLDFDAALALEPLIPAAYAFKAEAHRALREYDRALEALEALRGLVPDSMQAYYALADINLELGRYEKALAGFRKARTLDPERLVNHLAVIHVALESGAWPQALEETALALARFPDSLRVAASHVHALRAAGRGEEALESARARLRRPMDPHGSVDHLELAYLSAVAGETDAARKALASAGDFSSGELCAARARVHAVLQDAEGALEWLGRAVELHYHRSPNATPDPEFELLAEDERYQRLDREIHEEPTPPGEAD